MSLPESNSFWGVEGEIARVRRLNARLVLTNGALSLDSTDSKIGRILILLSQKQNQQNETVKCREWRDLVVEILKTINRVQV